MKSQELKEQIQKISSDLESLNNIRLETAAATEEAARIRDLMQGRISNLTEDMNSAKVSEELALLKERFPEYKEQ